MSAWIYSYVQRINVAYVNNLLQFHGSFNHQEYTNTLSSISKDQKQKFKPNRDADSCNTNFATLYVDPKWVCDWFASFV